MEKRTKGQTILMWVVFALFVIYAATLLFPFCWCLLNSFKSRGDFNFNIWGLPEEWVFENWVNCFNLSYNGVNILGMFGNSLIYMVGCTTVSMLSCSVTAYVLSKYQFRGRSAFNTTAIVLMMIPSMGSMAATYRLYHTLGFYNTYWGIIVTSCGGFGMGFVLLYGFFKNLSWAYAEAALVDGAGHFRIFFQIMLPQALPALGAVGIMQCIGIWNDYFTIYMYAPDKVTIALGLQNLVTANDYGKVSYPELFSVMIISIIPVVAVFAIFQKTIMENTVSGGIKG